MADSGVLGGRFLRSPHGVTERGPARSPARRIGPLRIATLAASILVVVLAGGTDASAAQPAEVVSRGPEAERTVALTFDDGWHAGRCKGIADTLARFGVTATWFPNAMYVAAAPRVWRRIAQRFPIANHTTNHRSLPSLSPREMRREIESNEERIESVTGRPMSKVLRPPFGAYDGRVLREAARLGYGTIALWDVTAADTSPRATDRRVARAALRGRAGSIVLMHCGPETTARVLPIVIARYACKGFRFATVEDLLAGRRGVEADVACPPPSLPAPARSRTVRSARAAAERRAGVRALAAHEWRLTDAASSGALEPLSADDLLTLRMDGRRASGSVGCDAYSVPVSAKADGSLSFGRLVRSREGCPDGTAAPPTDHLAILVEAAGYRIAEDSLDLVDGDGTVALRFRASPSPVGLIGDWVVTQVADDAGDLEAPPGPAALTVSFEATGTVRGSTGCDPFVGGYSTRGGSVSTGRLLVGTAPCGDERDALEARFLARLRAAATWALRGSALELNDADGRVLLVLEPPADRP